MENERCDFCHEGRLSEEKSRSIGTKAQTVREYYKFRGDLVIIDNVPAYVCSTCGEHYHNAQVAKRLRRIAENRSRIKKRIAVPITTFDAQIFDKELEPGIS